MKMVLAQLVLGVAVACLGCRSADGASAAVAEPVVVARPTAARAAAAAPGESSAPSPSDVIADDAPLREGRVTFTGMVTPTKGGLMVRGVVLDGEGLRRAIAGAPPSEALLLGARVRVTAELVRHEGPPAEADGLALQMRSGGLHAERVEAVVVVAWPVLVEGTLRRSKALFQVGDHLVTRRDLDWALAPDGGEEGQRVRLWGQPRVYTCGPHEQCLVGGSIPMFDVGRAERVP